MDEIERAMEIVKYKTEAQRLMRLLEDAKCAIRVAMDNSPLMNAHFSHIMKQLDANGIICCFDKKERF